MVNQHRAVGPLAGLLFLLSPCLTVSAGTLPQMPEPLEVVTLPDKPAAEHWVWLGDFQMGNYSRSLLYNADAGTLLGMIETGWEGIKPDFSRSSNEIYNLEMWMSRGHRGARTDTVTVFDRHSLKPLREIVVPPKGIHGWPDPNHTALSDDDRFLAMQFFTPASSIGIADLKAGSYAGEIETSGCAHIMAAGPRQYFTLCGDGSALQFTLDESGHELSRKRYPGLFDPDADPLHGSGTRSGNSWFFISFHGKVHEVQLNGSELRFVRPWNIAEKDGDNTWVPGPLMQVVSVHDSLKQLYVLMHPSDLKPKGGGPDFHREPGTEVWVFDMKTSKRVKRIPLKSPGTAVAVSQDESPLMYVSGLLSFAVDIYRASDGKHLRSIPIPGAPTLIQPVR